jgi:hypothetical protein
VQRLRRKLGGCDPAPFAPLPVRVRSGQGGRSQKRHDGLVAAIRAEESKLIDHMSGISSDLERRAQLRRMVP